MIRTIVIPDTETVSFTIPKNYIGKELEIIAFAKKEGLQQTAASEMLSPALQGNPLSKKEFTDWIKQAETMPDINLKEAKSKWKNKRSQLQQLTS